jgi:tRNA 2-thiouridine synthesizing protein E
VRIKTEGAEDAMITKTYAGKPIELNDEGYLLDSKAWDEKIASAIAAEEGIPDLSPDHWKVIYYMRKAYAQRGDGPSIRLLTKESGVDTRLLYQLFPKGPAKKAARIAGIPKPHGCI